MPLDFSCTRYERGVIVKIVDRALAMCREHKVDYDRLSCDMDITACHCNGNPLRLENLLDAEPYDFLHDILGIRRHIDRTTGKLKDCFLPRFTDNIAQERLGLGKDSV